MKDKKFGKSNKMQVQKLPTGIEGFDDVCRGGFLYPEVHSSVVHLELVKLFFRFNTCTMVFAILMNLESLLHLKNHL